VGAGADEKTITAATNAGSRPQPPSPIISALAPASVENSAITDLVSAIPTEALRRLIADAEQSYTLFRLVRFGFVLAMCLTAHMDQISVLAAGGMQSRMQSLDLVANNLANSSTSGYKSDGEFFTLFASEAASEDASGASSVPMIQRQWTDFGQGLLEPTNNPLDLGLSGKGFYVVQGPTGPLYTRNGNFRFSVSGALVTSEGYPLLQQNGEPFKANTAQPLEVSRDGDVSQKGSSIGRIKIAEFQNPAGLTKYGANFFSNTTGQEPVDDTSAQIYQGKIEASNVSASHGAVRIVSLMRQFEMMQKAVSLSNDMGRKAIEEVAKV
jgi:flagellar basal-body rod protein FlgF